MKNKFLKYDDQNRYLIISLVVSIIFITVSILVFKIDIAFYIFLFGSILSVINSLLVYITGIHFNYKRDKIIIINFLTNRTIKMNEVQYISYEELEKVRKSKKIPFFDDASHFASWQSSSKFLYRNGRTFNINIHMKDKSTIKVY